MSNRPLPLVLACFLGAAVLRAGEPLAIIVNPESGVSQLTRDQAVDIFMGREKHFASGLVALPVEQVTPPETRSRFYELLVNLPMPQVRAYWARLYFSGQAQPPRQTDGPEDTLRVVAANKGAIGFVELSKVDARVKVVLRLTERGAP